MQDRQQHAIVVVPQVPPRAREATCIEVVEGASRRSDAGRPRGLRVAPIAAAGLLLAALAWYAVSSHQARTPEATANSSLRPLCAEARPAKTKERYVRTFEGSAKPTRLGRKRSSTSGSIANASVATPLPSSTPPPTAAITPSARAKQWLPGEVRTFENGRTIVVAPPPEVRMHASPLLQP